MRIVIILSVNVQQLLCTAVTHENNYTISNSLKPLVNSTKGLDTICLYCIRGTLSCTIEHILRLFIEIITKFRYFYIPI
ncbi:protein of unknown function [Petrocella atlantisensis]|uniref:Uncharacterized protein n=1 Tax=Petrocella atlantisensis TaxID=2173034 RepID=A0A3P7RVV1_9FIRM|nr:protein of unknown function [Petrocella atlantisensis]